MKWFNILSITCLMSLGVVATSCSESFLEIYPEGSYTGESYYTSDEAVLKAGEPLYNRAWFNFNRRAILGLGSYRANDGWNPYASAEFARFQTTALTKELMQAWSSLYLAVTMSNSIIHDLTYNCGADVSEKVKNQVLGEAYLTRGASYFYMVRIWGPSILFENNDDVVLTPKRPLNPEDDVFKFLLRDFRKAAALLPEKGGNGRVSKYAAEGMLAKALLAYSGWNKGGTRDQEMLDECKALCEDVIKNSGAELMDNFADLFRTQNNNNIETLYAMQWADPLTGGWASKNALLSDLSFSDVCDVNCWGNNLQASVDMVEYFNSGQVGEERWVATFFTPGTHYDYINSEHGGYTYNKNWLQLKKGVVGKKEDNGGRLASMASPLNTYILRLADVYLTHAEACLGNNAVLSAGSEGLESLNIVRQRSGLDDLPNATFWDIVRERRVEFCFEYCNWFDMVSWYRWKPQMMLDFFNNDQNRGYEIKNNNVKKMNMSDGSFMLNYSIANYTGSDGQQVWRYNDDGTENPNFDIRKFKPLDVILTDANIFLPYPEADVLQNPYLSQDPEPYNFGDGE